MNMHLCALGPNLTYPVDSMGVNGLNWAYVQSTTYKELKELILMAHG